MGQSDTWRARNFLPFSAPLKNRSSFIFRVLLDVVP